MKLHQKIFISILNQNFLEESAKSLKSILVTVLAYFKQFLYRGENIQYMMMSGLNNIKKEMKMEVNKNKITYIKLEIPLILKIS